MDLNDPGVRWFAIFLPAEGGWGDLRREDGLVKGIRDDEPPGRHAVIVGGQEMIQPQRLLSPGLEPDQQGCGRCDKESCKDKAWVLE
jgi:hypothetical protein